MQLYGLKIDTFSQVLTIQSKFAKFYADVSILRKIDFSGDFV